METSGHENSFAGSPSPFCSRSSRRPCAHAADGKIDGKIAVVAAENFYGDIARQIGGDQVAVVSIMNNPDQDPHLFETTPGIVRQITGAQIVIFNGADYDPWMDKLLEHGAAAGPHRHRSPPTSCTKRPATIRISGTTPPPCRRPPRRSPRHSAPPMPRTRPTTTRGSKTFLRLAQAD